MSRSCDRGRRHADYYVYKASNGHMEVATSAPCSELSASKLRADLVDATNAQKPVDAVFHV